MKRCFITVIVYTARHHFKSSGHPTIVTLTNSSTYRQMKGCWLLVSIEAQLCSNVEAQVWLIILITPFFHDNIIKNLNKYLKLKLMYAVYLKFCCNKITFVTHLIKYYIYMCIFLIIAGREILEE